MKKMIKVLLTWLLISPSFVISKFELKKCPSTFQSLIRGGIFKSCDSISQCACTGLYKECFINNNCAGCLHIGQTQSCPKSNSIAPSQTTRFGPGNRSPDSEKKCSGNYKKICKGNCIARTTPCIGVPGRDDCYHSKEGQEPDWKCGRACIRSTISKARYVDCAGKCTDSTTLPDENCKMCDGKCFFIRTLPNGKCPVNTKSPNSNEVTTEVAVLSTTEVAVEDCLTIEEQKCSFPFTFNNKSYNYCPVQEDSQHWCATKVDKTGTYVSGKFGICGENCPLFPEASSALSLSIGWIIFLSFCGVFSFSLSCLVMHAIFICHKYRASGPEDTSGTFTLAWIFRHIPMYCSGKMQTQIKKERKEKEIDNTEIEVNEAYGEAFDEEYELPEIVDYNDYYA